MTINLEVMSDIHNSLFGLHYLEGFIEDENEVKHDTRIVAIGLIFITFSIIFIA